MAEIAALTGNGFFALLMSPGFDWVVTGLIAVVAGAEAWMIWAAVRRYRTARAEKALADLLRDAPAPAPGTMPRRSGPMLVRSRLAPRD